MTATRLTSSQPTPSALAVAATLIRSMARCWRIQQVTRRVSFAPSSAQVSGGLEVFSAADGVGAGESGRPGMQAGGEPCHRQIDESTLDMVALHPGHRVVRAGVDHVHRVGVDDGEGNLRRRRR